MGAELGLNSASRVESAGSQRMYELKEQKTIIYTQNMGISSSFRRIETKYPVATRSEPQTWNIFNQDV